MHSHFVKYILPEKIARLPEKKLFCPTLGGCSPQPPSSYAYGYLYLFAHPIVTPPLHCRLACARRRRRSGAMSLRMRTKKPSRRVVRMDSSEDIVDSTLRR